VGYTKSCQLKDFIPIILMHRQKIHTLGNNLNSFLIIQYPLNFSSFIFNNIPLQKKNKELPIIPPINKGLNNSGTLLLK
jgi:hypothetical protein